MKVGRRGQGCEGDTAGIDPQRRELLRMALAGSVMGGLGLQASVGHALPPPAAKGDGLVFADGFEPRSPAPGTPITTLRLVSATAQTAPWTAMQAFREGDVPAGFSVTVIGAQAQATIKNTWPDGSAKLVILAGTAAVGIGETPLTLSAGAATTGPLLSTAALMAAMTQPVVFSAGAFGTASFSGADWSAPFQTWVSGHRMSSWIYRKPIGADPHLVAWLEVRLYADGAVEVLPWIENGYLRVPGPTLKSDVYDFTMGGTQRFSAPIALRHHQRTPLISGTALSYWLGADPGVTPRHDAAYLMATEMVPSYAATVSPSNPIVTQLPATYVPLQQGSFRFAYTPPNANTGFDRDDMTTGGYGAPIGLLPEHDVLYLTTTENTFASVVRNGYSAGRYQIHYRDETTQRPIRFSQYPTLVLGSGSAFSNRGSSTTGSLTPAASGGNGPTWDTAHSPSVGFMAYLVTGRWYFMEQVLFAATVNYLGNGDNALLRTGSQGLHQTAVGAWQTRAAAWGWRTHAQALAIIPDEDTTLRGELVASAEANIAHFHGRYVAQVNNPFGFILPGEAYDQNYSSFAPWQQDFVTAAFGYSQALGLPISSTHRAQLAAFFAWKAQSVTMRLGASSAWWYINGAPYTIRISPGPLGQNSFINGTGPWLANPAAAYAATYASPPSWLGSTEGTLAFEFQPGYADAVRGMWANLQPALAYAVRFGVAGALDGYNRMVSASNWPSFQTAFNSFPVWSVRPA